MLAASKLGLSLQNPNVCTGYGYTASEAKLEWQSFSTLRASSLQTEQSRNCTDTWRFRLAAEPELTRQPSVCD